ncbi:MAG: hypothetical protein Tsb0021_10740 [Chlamydiales bacterium]
MLQKFNFHHSSKYVVGKDIYLVTRQGDVLQGFTIASVLANLVSIDKPPLKGSEKQGFTIKGPYLKPNWCEGRKQFWGACLSYEEACAIASKFKQ